MILNILKGSPDPDHYMSDLSMSDPTISDNDFKNKMAWVKTILKRFCYVILNPKPDSCGLVRHVSV